MSIEWKILETTWQKQQNVVAVYVFGSSEDGIVKEGSDIDFGVLFREKPMLDELADLRAGLQEILNIEDIDIVILNDVSVILQFEAVCGNCLYSADEVLRTAFVSLAAREYEDEMAMVKQCVMRNIDKCPCKVNHYFQDYKENTNGRPLTEKAVLHKRRILGNGSRR